MKAPEKDEERRIARLGVPNRFQDRMTPDLVFRDPYLLDFLGLGADPGGRHLFGADSTFRAPPQRLSDVSPARYAY